MRIFQILSQLCPLYIKDRPSGINFSEFVEALLQTILADESKQKHRFIFNVLDVDGDGYISGVDLITVIEQVP